MKTCEDCGCRIYEYGCINCRENDYIDVEGDNLDLINDLIENPPEPNEQLKDALKAHYEWKKKYEDS